MVGWVGLMGCCVGGHGFEDAMHLLGLDDIQAPVLVIRLLGICIFMLCIWGSLWHMKGPDYTFGRSCRFCTLYLN